MTDIGDRNGPAEALFPRFLEDEAEYTACEEFWKRLFRSVLPGKPDVGEWQPWRPRCYVNGTPFEKEDCPVFDVKNDRLKRAVKIHQWPPDDSGDAAIGAWIGDLPIYDDEDDPLWELSLNLVLTTESARRARTLLARWVDPRVSVHEMQRHISERSR